MCFGCQHTGQELHTCVGLSPNAMEIVSSPKHELVECPLKTLLTGGLPDKAALQTTLGGLVGLSWNLLYRPVSGTMAKACIP